VVIIRTACLVVHIGYVLHITATGNRHYCLVLAAERHVLHVRHAVDLSCRRYLDKIHAWQDSVDWGCCS